MSASERVVQSGVGLTFRESKYVKARIEGKSEADALRAAGFSEFIARVPNKLSTIEEMRAMVETCQRELSAHTIEVGLADAKEIHEYLTEALRARISDIQNDDFTYKPFSEWPDIWQRMYEGGDIEVTTEYARSTDGKDGEKRGGWDASARVTDVKLKFSNKTKLIELLMKHRGVNAMVDQKSGDVHNHLHIHADIVDKLQGALKRKAIIEAGDVSDIE